MKIWYEEEVIKAAMATLENMTVTGVEQSKNIVRMAAYLSSGTLDKPTEKEAKEVN